MTTVCNVHKISDFRTSVFETKLEILDGMIEAAAVGSVAVSAGGGGTINPSTHILGLEILDIVLTVSVFIPKNCKPIVGTDVSFFRCLSLFPCDFRALSPMAAMSISFLQTPHQAFLLFCVSLTHLYLLSQPRLNTHFPGGIVIYLLLPCALGENEAPSHWVSLDDVTNSGLDKSTSSARICE